jgi:hypothetical protein
MRDNRWLVFRLSLALVLGPAGCISPGLKPHPDEQRAIADTMYFGSVQPNGVVSEEDWQGFVAKEITPRFPQGLTSWQASGQWLSAAGVLQRERSFVLHIVHPDSAKDEQAVQEIMRAYRKTFQQESVLRVRNTVWVSF